MSGPVNVECIRVVARKHREAEAPYKEACDPRGLGIGAVALLLENTADEIERLRAFLQDALHSMERGGFNRPLQERLRRALSTPNE